MLRLPLARLRAVSLALALCLGALPVHAVTLAPLPAGLEQPGADSDLALNALCSAGGQGNFGCEAALVQFRGGDGLLSGNQMNEVVILDVNKTPTSSNQVTKAGANFTHAANVVRPFTITFDPTRTQQVAVDFAGTKLATAETLADVRTLILRVRAGSRGGLAMTDMVINGLKLPDMVVAATEADSRTYLAVTGFDETKPFTFTGNATFTFRGTQRPSSSVIFEAKFTDLEVAPVPLPAAGLLLLGGLGALAAARRRRSAA
jgi:hypothetical protein